ncbi:MAG: hypothetical protein PQJ59_01525 [Spirochaetales bacterium]|nr:hypothetical protein [Spirochaetales bacterium]
MTEKVNYEDNLFFLSQTIDLLERGARLNLDRELFFDKILDTLYFTDKTLQSIFKELTENNYLINRNLYLHSLMKKKRKFTALLVLFLERDQGEWIPEEEDRSRLRRSLEVHKADMGDIRNTLSLSDSREEEREIISEHELNFLMAPGLLDEDEE